VKYRLEVTRVTADTHAQMVAPHNLDLGSRIPPSPPASLHGRQTLPLLILKYAKLASGQRCRMSLAS
jgi:hypothetical protein